MELILLPQNINVRRMCKKETNGVADFFLNQLFKKKTFKGLCHEISDSSSIIPFKTSDLEANIFSCVHIF